VPPEFQIVKLRLAREKGHPAGDLSHGYDILMPLDDDGHILPDLWRKHRDLCRVRRFRPGEEDKHGMLARRPGGSWYFDYNRDDDGDDENAVREDDDTMHTFQIIAIAEP